MTRNALISEQRLKLIEKRQLRPGWGAMYQPSMRATRDEAPTRSRPTTLYSAKLDRDLQFMALPERAVALLALYHPALFELREQHMLSPFPAPHPLAELLNVLPSDLPHFSGTVDVAHRLGKLSAHPVVRLSEESTPGGEPVRAAFPYLGDLLVFLEDDAGKYCVNWTVKKHQRDFSQPSMRVVNPLRREKARLRAELRHQIEELYFSDAGIRTVRVAESDIDQYLIANLTWLFGWANHPVSLDEDAYAQILRCFQSSIGTPVTPLSQLDSLAKRHAVGRHDCLKALYSAIWNRQLRVDLYRPIQPDKPLRAERSDVLIDFDHWFKR
ncbi:hypothetical protein ACFWP0_12190 [Achromobacter sp. NPDC058515]|uniref:hypothetical protein n=1 Tax=Achromobacter sp. NPDC058515 TaxID=3346533 RepID=UPI00366505FC